MVFAGVGTVGTQILLNVFIAGLYSAVIVAAIPRPVAAPVVDAVRGGYRSQISGTRLVLAATSVGRRSTMTEPTQPEADPADVAEQQRGLLPDPDDPQALAGQVSEVPSVPEADLVEQQTEVDSVDDLDPREA